MNGKNASEQHGGNVFAAIRKTGIQSANILDFSANINPLGLANSALQAIHNSLSNIVHYPDPNAFDLKETISAHYQVPTTSITVGNGAVELLYILCHMKKPRKVLTPAPTFSEYSRAANACGASVQYFYLSANNNFYIDTDAIAENLDGIDIVFICNPNNPTGTLMTNQQIKVLLDAAQKTNTLVVVDESFTDFLPDASSYTCRKLLSSYANLVIIHSLTKFYAIPGLRLGFALASSDITQNLHRGKDPWNVNTLSQAVGISALNDQAYQIASRLFMQNSQQDLWEKLSTLNNLFLYPPTVNYMLVNIGATGITSTLLREFMMTKGILIRDCSNYPGLNSEYIRLAVKTPEHHNQLLSTLKEALGEIS